MTRGNQREEARKKAEKKKEKTKSETKLPDGATHQSKREMYLKVIFRDAEIMRQKQAKAMLGTDNKK
jgi:4F5 protein family protein